MKRVRRLTPKGLEEFDLWLDQVAYEERGVVPEILLDGPLTELFEEGVEVDETQLFLRRFEWGVYIDRVFEGRPTRQIASDAGLWAWLTLVFFDQVCPIDANGRRKLFERPRYVPRVSDYKTYFRHLLMGPWSIVRSHRDRPERALAVLANPLHSPGEAGAQIPAYQSLVSSKPVLEVATRLYYDPAAGRTKKGASGSGPGSPRRLVAILNQFELTFDFQEIGSENLLERLPKEFRRFLGAPPPHLTTVTRSS